MKKLVLFVSCIYVLASCTHQPKLVRYTPTPRAPAQAVEWFSASEDQVKSALCRNNLPNTTAEIFNYYKSLSTRGLEDGVSEVQGLKLVNEKPPLILALAKLLAPAPREAVTPLPDDLTSAFKIPASCNKVLCAAQKIFGDDVGPQMIFLMDRFNVNTSPYSYGNADTFNASEISDILRTFEFLYPGQTPFAEANKRLIKFKRGYTLKMYESKEGTVLANSSIELFDSWSEEKPLSRQNTLYHEFAHNFSRSYFSSTDISSTWLNLSQWKGFKEKDKNDIAVTKFKSALTETVGHPFVSQYGKENPFEDFAESVVSYRFNPQLLKKQSPEKYKLLKHIVFNGLEYTSEKSCKTQMATTTYQKQIDKNKDLFSEKEKQGVLSACRLTFNQTVLSNVPVSFFDDCVNYEATLIWYSKNHRAYTDLLPKELFDQELRLSRLKFLSLRKELAQELAPQTAAWIMGEVKKRSSYLKMDMSDKETCELWTRISYVTIPGDSTSEWNLRAPYSLSPYPNAGAARGMCLDLIQGLPPKKPVTVKSTYAQIKLELQKFLRLHSEPEPATSEEENDRGLNELNVLKYIQDKVGL